MDNIDVGGCDALTVGERICRHRQNRKNLKIIPEKLEKNAY
jgi:hypothetical protein